jgi:hypothetical protein
MSQELVPSSNKWLPEVVDDSGKPVVGPELEAVTNTVMNFAQLAQLAHIRKSVESQNFQGFTDPRDIGLSPGHENDYLDLVNFYPFTPWTYVQFESNKDAQVSINDRDHFFDLHAGRPLKVNRLGAAQRISLIYFQVPKGQSAHIAVTGEY